MTETLSVPRRDYPEAPVAAVGAVVRKIDRSVLLVRRANPPLQGEWSIPGGVVELGETLEAAVRREVLEETGILVEPGRAVEVLDRILLDPAGRVQYHYILVDFLCEAKGGELCCASDASQAAWVSEAEIASGAAEYQLAELTLKVVRKALLL